MAISKYKQTLFNDIYFNNYPKQLKEIGLNPKECMIVKMVPMHGIIDYPFESKEDFYNVYFKYLSDHLGTDIESAYDFYVNKYNLFYEIMEDELSVFTDEEICKLYVDKSIYNFYNGIKFEKDVLSLIPLYVVRDDEEREFIDNVLKIDIELASNDNLYGLQLKCLSYINTDNKLKQYHKKQFNNYIDKFDAANVFYLFHNADLDPVRLKSNRSYLIPFEEINNYTINDFETGSFGELQNELSNF